MGSHYLYEGKICAKKEKSISIIKKREREGIKVYKRTIEKKVY